LVFPSAVQLAVEQEQAHQPLPQSMVPLAFAHSSFSVAVGDPESLRSQMGTTGVLHSQ